MHSLFPVAELPEEISLAKLVGLHPQRQEKLWMQRIKIHGGRLTGPQWRALGSIVQRFTPTTPLHLTTRQELELHNLPAHEVGAVQQAIFEVGLTALAAGGDSIRNIIVCPLSGVVSGTVDLGPLAWQIRNMLEQIEGIFSLPRKFKISFSATAEAWGQPWINDLGFVAKKKDGQWGFRVIGAGSLGARPATGIELFAWIPARLAPAMVLAAVRVFERHGDRENRRTARLRHVRERLGDDSFLEILRSAFQQAQAERDWPDVDLPQAPEGFTSHRSLVFSNGDVHSDAAEALADLADRQDLRVRIANQHRVLLFGPDEKTLAQAIDSQESLRQAARPQATIVACSGKRWCSRALAYTDQLADRIRQRLGRQLPPDLTLCISGCPNGCAHSAVGEIGLSGAIATKDGLKREVWDIRLGGGMGQNNKLAEIAARKLTAEQVIEEISRYLGSR